MSGSEPLAPTLDEIASARERIADVVRLTPVITSGSLSRLVGRPILLKAENLQRTGSFKIRGAYNTIVQLNEAEREAGVVTASAGNHGQAVAWAAREAGLPATILVPTTAPMAKVEAARAYGAEVVLAGSGFDECVLAARELVSERGATFVHAFDDLRVIAGQGTLGLELAEQLPAEAETVVIPVGGGGLAAGIGLAVRALRPTLRLIGVQSAACAPYAGLAPAGATIADGIAVKHPGELTAPLLRSLLDEIVVVDDQEISQALVLLAERAKLVVEGAGAAAFAALLTGKVAGSGPACAVLAGGNIDATTLNSVIRFGLTAAGRHLVVRILIPDRPGQLARIVAVIAENSVNIISVAHHREGHSLDVLETQAELTLETRDEAHSQAVIQALSAAGFTVERPRA